MSSEQMDVLADKGTMGEFSPPGSLAKEIMQNMRAGDRDQPDFRDLEGGGILWKASLVLLYFLERKVDLRGKKVLEISSGEGHLAWALQQCGAHVTATEHGGQEVEKLMRNVESRKGEEDNRGSIRVVPLTWGVDAWDKSPLAAEEADYDYIVMSELVFETDLHDELLWSMRRLCSPKTVVYHIFLDRPFSFMFFAKVDDTHEFEVEAVAEEDMDRSFLPPDACVHMHILRLKPETR